MGSEDIDSGEVSQSGDDAEGSDAEGSDADSAIPSRDLDDAAAGSDEGEDEVGDLSWEAVMAAVQGGGSDDEADEEQGLGSGSHVADAAEPLPRLVPQQTSQRTPSPQLNKKQSAAPAQRKSRLGKRSRQK